MIKITVKTTPQRLKVINASLARWDITNNTDKSIMYLVMKKITDKYFTCIGKPQDKELKISFYYHEAYTLYNCLLDVCDGWPNVSYERNVILKVISDLYEKINNWNG